MVEGRKKAQHRFVLVAIISNWVVCHQRISLLLCLSFDLVDRAIIFLFSGFCDDHHLILLIVLYVFVFLIFSGFVLFSLHLLGILVSRSQYQLSIHIDNSECLQRISSRFNKFLCLINDVALLPSHWWLIIPPLNALNQPLRGLNDSNKWFR